MLTAAVVLNLIGAVGLFALASKYVFGPVPADYHGEIFDKTAQPVGDGLTTVLRALYRALGATSAAIGAGIVIVTLFGIRADLLWAKATVLVMVLFAGVPTLTATRKVAQVTGVQTPWKPTLVLILLGVVAFVLSVI